VTTKGDEESLPSSEISKLADLHGVPMDCVFSIPSDLSRLPMLTRRDESNVFVEALFDFVDDST
jgi:hypothetical protein